MRAGHAIIETTLRLTAILTVGAQLSSAWAQEDAVFRDDFTGKALRPEWKLVAGDPDRWTLADNEYLLVVSSFAKKEPPNVFRYNGKRPDDYRIVMKVQTPPKHDGQYIRLRLQRDKDNSLVLGYTPSLWNFRTARRLAGNVPTNASGAFFGKRLRGQNNYQWAVTGRLDGDKPLYLRITKDGVEYTAAYSLDGTAWTDVGTHVFLNLNGTPDFTAANFSASAPESGIRFDSFEIGPAE